MNYKRLLVDGAVFITGAGIGAILASPDHNERKIDDEVWKGESTKLEIDKDIARIYITKIDKSIESDTYGDYKFAASDLKDVQTKLSHALSDCKSNDTDLVNVELYDRERLRLMEIIDVIDIDDNDIYKDDAR